MTIEALKFIFFTSRTWIVLACAFWITLIDSSKAINFLVSSTNQGRPEVYKQDMFCDTIELFYSCVKLDLENKNKTVEMNGDRAIILGVFNKQKRNR